MKELEKNYDPKIVEDRLYKEWTEKKYFKAEVNESKEPFTIVMPPPNITGQLHMGHALDCTYQDILIRWKRMAGYEALWLPGTDHASISTELKIVEKMAKEGLTKKNIGRDEFLKRAWDWRKEYGGTIVGQLKKLGSSCDWDRERFTLDDGLSDAVLEVFVRLYEKGLIYRGEKLINWCPVCKTSISDAEVDHEERDSFLWHLKYPVDQTGEFVEFATTRPETMLGDTAVAVNPGDERYSHLIGKTVTVPVVNRKIPIIADNYVEMDFGTGVVKITPAHDPNDFEVGQRHNLPAINIMNDDGTLNKNAGKYEGLDRYEAREKLLEEFESLGLFVKKVPLNHSVGIHEKCKEVVEPLIKLQWFVKMDDLVKPAIEAVKTGELRFVPDRFSKIYLNWLTNIRDWCISRQLWWGHRIPAYYCMDCGEMHVSKFLIETCKKCGSKNIKQDEDVLDTWFSSALWPFSTLGWPEETPDYKYFYPTNVLVTSYDIIFFWVARMVFSGIEQTGKIPFKDVLMHGLVRDASGKKMSKSAGNGIDPLELIDQYGADALRLTIISGSALENDSRFYYEKLESNRNFLNKLWNATRFVLMHIDETDPETQPVSLTAADKWILSKVNSLIKEVGINMDAYEFNVAVTKIYDFIWDEYCDWYIEMVKPRLYNKEDETRNAAVYTLRAVLLTALKLLHPFMPFITEEIFLSLQFEKSHEETIMLSKWPHFEAGLSFPKEEREIGLIKDAIKGIRNVRTEMNVPPSKKANLYVVSEDEAILGIFETGSHYLKALGFAENVFIEKVADTQENAVTVPLAGCMIYIPLNELVDFKKEILRLKKEEEKIKDEISRVNGKLNNEGFVKKAPERIILEEKEKLSKYEALLNQIQSQLESMESAEKM